MTPHSQQPPNSHDDRVLNFSVLEGSIHNEFYRDAVCSAHLTFTSGNKPRIVVAFPAGNSGISLWCDETNDPVNLKKISHIESIQDTDWEGNTRHGIKASLEVEAERIVINKAVLGSVRVIRDYMHLNELQPELEAAPVVDNKAVWERQRVDGKCSYKASLSLSRGHIETIDDERIALVGERGSMVIEIAALTGEKPLTPLFEHELLKEPTKGSELTRNVLEFLSYREKMLAGSWQYLTYFGRDTLMSLSLLMPALTPQAIEAGLRSVLERIDDAGQVAHEEDIGEFPMVRRHGHTSTCDKPIYDYAMVDDDFMFLPILASYVVDSDEGESRANHFLKTKLENGEETFYKVLKNINFVLKAAEPFFKSATASNLISLKHGHPVGEWRDSHEGLGFGRIPYNVNGVLVAAALDAIAKLMASGLITLEQMELTTVIQMKVHWETYAPRFFETTIDSTYAKALAEDYAKDLGLKAELQIPENQTFYAIAINSDGEKLNVMNSDFGFELLFGKPNESMLTRVVSTLTADFPLGLASPVGLLVANPVVETQPVKDIFTHFHYHGTVVWSWQQALFAAGLHRQLARTDIDQSTRKTLEHAEQKVWACINSTPEKRNSELWSWKIENNNVVSEPFGQGENHVTESNAAQLWSTVYLGLASPLVALT